MELFFEWNWDLFSKFFIFLHVHDDWKWCTVYRHSPAVILQPILRCLNLNLSSLLQPLCEKQRPLKSKSFQNDKPKLGFKAAKVGYILWPFWLRRSLLFYHKIRVYECVLQIQQHQQQKHRKISFNLKQRAGIFVPIELYDFEIIIFSSRVGGERVCEKGCGRV